MNAMKKVVKGLFCIFAALAAGVAGASVPSDGLAAAVADAADGAVIELDEGEYTISAELVVDRGITVKGAGIGKTILKGTQGSVRYLTVKDGATVEGLTIKGKDISCSSVNGTGLYISGTLKDCRVTGFKGMAYYQKGTIYVSGANALVTGCAIDGNQACYREDGGIDYGAGIYLVSGTVSDCVVSNNIAKGGAGIYMSGGRVERTEILNNRLVHNSGAGGSYSYYESKTAESWGTGGGVYMTGGTLSECLVAGNKGTINSGVGGVYVSGKSAAIKNCIIRGNVSPGIRASLHPDLSYDNVAVEANVSGCHLPVEFGSDCNTDAVLFRDASHNDFTVIGEIAANRTEALTSDTVTLTSTVDGSASWAFTDRSGQVIEAEGMEVSRTFPAGVYDIKLTVGGVDYECKSALRIGAVKYSVSSDEELASALKLAQDGSTIELADGSYTVSSRITMTNAVTLTGSHYTNCTIALKSTVYDRLLIVANQNALVRGITLSGGRLSHYGKIGTPAINGVGVWINSAGGTITRCRMTGAKSDDHYECGAVAIQNSRGKITHSVIDGNDLTTGGNTSFCGGVYVNGTLDNCLICNNKANSRGGIGVNSSAKVYNCTIVNNTASSSGSGVWIFNTNARLVNCLIGSNPSDGANQYSGSAACFQNCAFVGTTAYGTDCVTLSDPYVGFATKDYHIVPGSSGAADRGIVYDGMPETDLDGNLRVQGEFPDAGCYEVEANKFSCGTDADSGATSGDTRICFVGTTVRFFSSVDNAPDGATMTYAWTFTDRLGNVTQSSEQNPQLALPAGWYTVDLTVSVVGDPAKTAVAATRVDYVHVCPKDLYAVAGNEHETYPWDSPANGTSNVLALVDEALDGTTIHIGEGDFVIKKEMAISKRLTVTGEGWEKSVIRMSPNANYRVLRMNNKASVVERVTLANGRCAIYNGRDGDGTGVGVLISGNGGELRDCRVTGALSKEYFQNGAGISVESNNAFVRRCLVDHNDNRFYGASATIQYGGGLYVTAGLVENCLVVSNYTRQGGGVHITGGTVRNCTFAFNKAVRCQQDNKTGGAAGGVSFGNGKLQNCVFYGNTADASSTGYPEWLGSGTEVKNCGFADTVKTNATTGGSCVLFAEPGFRDAVGGDFHLLRASPLVNAGDRLNYTKDSVDLDGNGRIMGFNTRKRTKCLPDLGCYESPWGTPGLLLWVR